MAEELFIPKLGQTVEEVTLVKWLVEDGARVTQGQEVLEVETDKAIFPVEAKPRGVIHIGPYKEGKVLPVLTVVAIIGKPEDKFEAQGSGACRPDRQSRYLSRPLPPPCRPSIGRRCLRSARGTALCLSARPQAGRGEERRPGRGHRRPAAAAVRVAERDVLAFLASVAQSHPGGPAHGCREPASTCAGPGTGPGGRIVKEDITAPRHSRIIARPIRQFVDLHASTRNPASASRSRACAPSSPSAWAPACTPPPA